MNLGCNYILELRIEFNQTNLYKGELEKNYEEPTKRIWVFTHN